jgi:S-ribosylhomocysteine lyase
MIVKDGGESMELRQIASFQVDHRKIGCGMFISRVDGDIVTYDIRMKKPNAGSYLENAAIHTIEHLFATYARSGGLSDKIVYVGPMGCRTGFYLLVRGMSHAEAVDLVKSSFEFIAAFSGSVPGVSEKECGNWREHDLPGAKAEAKAYLGFISGWDEDKLGYPS